MTRRHVALGLAVFALSALTVLILADLMVRFLRPDLGEHFQYDPIYLHKYVPDARAIFRRSPADGGATIRIAINQYGFRGPDFSVEKHGPRVMVYGDSFIAAEFSELSQTFPKQLETALNASSPRPIQVINAGVPAYGLDQVSLRLDEELDRYLPDVVIVALFTGNDFGDNIRDKLFALDPRGQLIRRSSSLPPRRVLTWRLRRAFPSLAFYRQLASPFLDPRPPEPSAASDYFDATVRLAIQEYENYQSGDRYVTNLFFDHYDFDMLRDPDSERTRYKVLLMKGIVNRIKQSLEARHIHYCFLVIPSRHEIVPRMLTDTFKPGQTLGADIRYLSSVSNTLLRELGANYLDLTAPFLASNRGNSYYWNHVDEHWNDVGQRYAAQLTAQKLLHEYFRTVPPGRS